MGTYSFFWYCLCISNDTCASRVRLLCVFCAVFSLNVWNLKVGVRLREAGGSRGEAERVEQHYPVHARPGHVPWVSKRRMAG